MKDLSQRARELLEAGKPAIEPGPGAAQRVRDRLTAALEAGAGDSADTGAAGSADGLVGAGGQAGAGLSLKLMLVVTAIAGGAALTYLVATSGSDVEPTPPEPAVPSEQAKARVVAYADKEPLAEPRESTQGPPPPAAPPDAGVHEREARQPRSGPARAQDSLAIDLSSEPRPDTRVHAPSPPPSGSLSAELRFIESARAHLARGDARRALAVLSRHAAEFPSGQLAQEAAELRVRALCRAGNDEQAEAEASRLLERWPASPFAGREGEVCGR
jgi:hypothetical protein